ncbi:hypothetical protein BDY21DRAFT_368265 [Lineolata rhizophorae]|uniref:Protein kinase domain-containing protein n=1 Tax=Lineolata rhizophorae TaxID=578093 RepID=A0A6A6PFK1_9PEZI|nr:hypothetical protein BDY21DRAFT_368265 [Lineolata rhizophorae]
MEHSMPRPTRGDAVEESGGSGAEGRARKRFQRSENTPRQPTARVPADSKHGFTNRRRNTLREHKAPQGPRPLDLSSNRRNFSDAVAVPAQYSSRSFLPQSSENVAHHHDSSTATASSSSNNPRYSFGKSSDESKARTNSSASFEFLPPVNFDDFHARITGSTTHLADFAHHHNGSLSSTSIDAPTPVEQDRTPASTANTGPAGRSSREPDKPESRIARSQSITRRLSTTRAAGSTSSIAMNGAASMAPPNAPLSMRNRRQSQFPPTATSNPAGRVPRKSVGPGLVPVANAEGKDQNWREQGPMTSNAGEGGSHDGGGLGPMASVSRTRQSTAGVSGSDAARAGTGVSARSVKAKSLQPGPRHSTTHVNSPALTPDPSLGNSTHSAKSPLKSPAHRSHTPSSSASKRQSTVNLHVGGLGARTISPTDARRMKRLSLHQSTPKVSNQPPTPQPEPPPEPRSVMNSPALIFRKSVTPGSNSATPEPAKKPHNHGLSSLSSNSSFTSLRNSNGTAPHRVSQNLSTSRLPTPKPRNVHSSAGVSEEEVPPVPAIPKAYESPKDQVDNPGFPASRKGSAQASDEDWAKSALDASTPCGQSVLEGSNNFVLPNETRKSKGNGRHKRGLTVGAGSSEVEPAPTVQHINKKNLQPLRLPPLNLLPLSTPTQERIASLPAPSMEVDDRTTTPPPSRPVAKTPSTPMTASKASFFTRNRHESEDVSAFARLRSSSSHFNLRTDSTNYMAPNAPVAIPASANSNRHITTPFASSSLPKTSGDYSNLRSRPSGEFIRSRPSGEYKRDVDAERGTSRLTGPRPQKHASKETNSSTTTATTASESERPQSPSSTSIRRKLSLSWRRGSTKTASQAQQNGQATDEQQQAPEPPKHTDMPPPKLPASATWNGSLGKSPSPTTKSRPSLDARRRKPSMTGLASDTEGEAQSQGRGPSRTTNSLLSRLGQHERQTGNARSASGSAAPDRIAAQKSAATERDLAYEKEMKDIRSADAEMKTLCSTKRNLEREAKELDLLRSRARPNSGVTPAQAIARANLNMFERGEIVDYEEAGVFFCGTKDAKKVNGDMKEGAYNFGYDDERGDYNIVMGDHLAYRYEVVSILGKGSFGQVVKCIDHKLGKLVAIKIIRNKKRFHHQALIEVNILQKIRDWDPRNQHSMIRFTQSFYFRQHLCISTELLGMNLYEFIKVHEFRGFSLDLIRRFAKQILSSLVLLKSKNVIHCDLKPENILICHPHSSEIKVIDFGSSCFVNEKVYTYIQSRFYRSPEVIMGIEYGLPIDIWSFGCILAELFTGYPIFPGENEQEQLACIMEIFGPPSRDLVETADRKKLFFDSNGKPRVTVSPKGRRRRPSSKTLNQALKCDDPAFLDFLSRCLRWDPAIRLKPDEALQHDFITGKRTPGGLSNSSTANAVPRPRAPTASSAAKRVATNSSTVGHSQTSSTAQTPQRGTTARPLPEPPSTAIKSSASPIKPSGGSNVTGGPRRHSTVNGLPTTNASGVKRTSNGLAATSAAASTGSALPRVAQRSVSNRSDHLGASAAMTSSAAAAAALKNSRQ